MVLRPRSAADATGGGALAEVEVRGNTEGHAYIRGVNVALGPFPIDRFEEPQLVDKALVAIGLPRLRQLARKGPGFVETLGYPMDGLDLMVADLLPHFDVKVPTPATGAVPCPFAATYADVWLPTPFSGLVVVNGVPGVFNDHLTLASAFEVRAQAYALANAIDLPHTVPDLDPERPALSEWREGLAATTDPSAPIWQLDPDAAFYVALFLRVADYAIAHRQIVGYD